MLHQSPEIKWKMIQSELQERCARRRRLPTRACSVGLFLTPVLAACVAVALSQSRSPQV